MNHPAILAGVSLCIAACAAPLPQAQDSVAAAPPPAATPVDTEDSGDVIQVVDVPRASTVADVPTLRSQQERVCQRERRTGSNRVVRVCRTRAEIAKDELESKELFDELHRSQREYNR